ncbi:MAG TPA: hypothetical protein VMW52_07825 [Phycisphaerae bacterium]|nr:hypothetical protein [Phycisphaerae bacterium]
MIAKTTCWTFGADPDTDWLTEGNWDNGVAVASPKARATPNGSCT